MSEQRFAHALSPPRGPTLGLVVLQADETIEQEFRQLLPRDVQLLTSRVPSGREVTPESLAAMEAALEGALALFPEGARFDALAYACTSGAAQIGTERVAQLLRDHGPARATTDPVTALLAACASLGLRRLAMLSPYCAPVSERVRAVLAAGGVETPAFGSFDVMEEARVARIDTPSIVAAASSLARGAPVDGIFLSCTNLRTLEAGPAIADKTGLPVLSSNSVLAWHLAQLAGLPADRPEAGRRAAIQRGGIE